MVTRPYDWSPYVAAAASQYGVPPALINSVINAESSGRPNAMGPVTRSGQQAGGLMQLMPNTFAELQQTYGFGADRMAPENNISAGTAYLAQLYRQFGNWPDAISAYNAGPNRWRQVQAGKQDAPRETTDYTKKVLASFGETPARDVAAVPVPKTIDEGGNMPSFSFAAPQQQRVGSLTGLLEVDDDKNYYDGLGLLGNFGQTPSDPPRTDPAALPGTTQTDRLDLSGRINTMLEQYLQQPQKAMPSQLQYMLAGAQKGVQGLAGTHDRPVGIGEMLGALGGGVTSGGLAYDEAAAQRQGSDLDRLLKAGVYQNQQRTADLNERNAVYDNEYKRAATIKALTPDRDAKVVGKGVYVDGKWIQAPWANNAAESGPFPSEGLPSQLLNTYYALEQKRVNGGLNTQEQLLYDLTVRQMQAPKTMMTPEGLGTVAPGPLPQLGGAAPAAAPSPAPVPAPAPQAGGAATPAPAVAPPAATGPQVTTLVPNKPKEIPATAQTAMLANVEGLRKVNAALAEVDKSDWTTGNTAGLLNMLPGDTLNAVLPGASGRAALADIGSMIIHDRSGAAVTISEFPRLKPFVPNVSDNAETVKMKLGKLRTELEDILRDQSATYSADQSYRENPVVRDAVAAIRPRAPMSGGESTDPVQRTLRSKYGLE